MRFNNVFIVMLINAALFMASCGPGGGQDNTDRQIPFVPETGVAYDATKLKSLLEDKDYTFMVKFLPKINDSLDVVIQDAGTKAQLRSENDKALTLAEKMAAPHTSDIDDQYKSAIDELSSKIQSALSKLSEIHHEAFNSNLEQQALLARNESNALRNQNAIFMDADLMYLNKDDLTKAYKFEALAIYLATKFQKGVDTLSMLTLGSELKDFITAVNEINEADRKKNKRDFSKFPTALKNLIDKIVSSLDKKITQGQKNDVINNYWKDTILLSIETNVQKVLNKTVEVQAKINALSDKKSASVKEAIAAANELTDAVTNSQIDETFYVIKNAKKLAEEAHKDAANIAKKAVDEAVKTNKASVAEDFVEAVKSARGTEAETIVKETEKAAEKIVREAKEAESVEKALSDAKAKFKRITDDFSVIDKNLFKLPQHTKLTASELTFAKLSSAAVDINAVFSQANLTAKKFKDAEDEITAAEAKKADVKSLKDDFNKAKVKVTEAYKTAAAAAKTIAGKLKAENENAHNQAKLVNDLLDGFISKKVFSADDKTKLNKEYTAAKKDVESAKELLKNAQAFADKIAEKIPEFFIIDEIAADGLAIAKTVATDVQAASNAYADALNLLKQAEKKAEEQFNPMVKKMGSIESIKKRLQSVNKQYAELKQNYQGANEIKALTEHDKDSEKKAESFAYKVLYAFDAAADLKKIIDKADNEIVEVRKIVPVDDLTLPKKDAEDVIENINTGIKLFEADLAKKAMMEALAFSLVFQKAKKEAEKDTSAIIKKAELTDEEIKQGVASMHFLRVGIEAAKAIYEIYSTLEQSTRNKQLIAPKALSTGEEIKKAYDFDDDDVEEMVKDLEKLEGLVITSAKAAIKAANDQYLEVSTNISKMKKLEKHDDLTTGSAFADQVDKRLKDLNGLQTAADKADEKIKAAREAKESEKVLSKKDAEDVVLKIRNEIEKLRTNLFEKALYELKAFAELFNKIINPFTSADITDKTTNDEINNLLALFKSSRIEEISNSILSPIFLLNEQIEKFPKMQAESENIYKAALKANNDLTAALKKITELAKKRKLIK